jgi:hypothetical protein
MTKTFLDHITVWVFSYPNFLPSPSPPPHHNLKASSAHSCTFFPLPFTDITPMNILHFKFHLRICFPDGPNKKITNSLLIARNLSYNFKYSIPSHHLPNYVVQNHAAEAPRHKIQLGSFAYRPFPMIIYKDFSVKKALRSLAIKDICLCLTQFFFYYHLIWTRNLLWGDMPVNFLCTVGVSSSTLEGPLMYMVGMFWHLSLLLLLLYAFYWGRIYLIEASCIWSVKNALTLNRQCGECFWMLTVLWPPHRSASRVFPSQESFLPVFNKYLFFVLKPIFKWICWLLHH